MYTQKYVFQHAYMHTYLDKAYTATRKKFLNLVLGMWVNILLHFFYFWKHFTKQT